MKAEEMRASLGSAGATQRQVSYLEQRTQQVDPLRVQPGGGQSTVKGHR